MQIHIFIEPKFRPDKHHLCTGSRSNESSRRNLAEKPAYFAGCRLLSTTVLHAFLLKYVNFSLQNRQISGAEARYTSARAREARGKEYCPSLLARDSHYAPLGASLHSTETQKNQACSAGYVSTEPLQIADSQ